MTLEWGVVIAMLADVARLMGGTPIADLPAVRTVPVAELRAVCGRCEALYVRPVVMVSETVDLNSPEGRSVLVHELVHHYQALTRPHADPAPCEQRRVEELEAYAIQNEWNRENRIHRWHHFMAAPCARGGQ